MGSVSGFIAEENNENSSSLGLNEDFYEESLFDLVDDLEKNVVRKYNNNSAENERRFINQD